MPCSGSQKTAPSPAFQAPSPVGRGWKVAFTLAEVLITLGIIGVVAAMTMPTLMAKYQEKVTVNKMKKMYSVLSQAYNMYLSNNEPVIYSNDEQGANDTFNNIFKPYLKVAKDCGTGDGRGCISQSGYTLKNGGSVITGYSASNYYKVLLADGSSIWFRGGTSILDIFYDVNGENGPNQWGTDLFEFIIDGREIYPNGIPGKRISNNCVAEEESDDPDNGRGYGCGAWVIFKENMDYLKCPDELSWNGKTKCD